MATPTSVNKPWLLWEVMVPLGLPVIISIVVVVFEQTGPHPRDIDLQAAIDIALWTLCFFSFNLLASSMRRIWPKFSLHPAISIWMLATMIPVALYVGELVAWHQDASFKPGIDNYLVSGFLTVVAIWSSHASGRI
jgi:hypothetical protein